MTIGIAILLLLGPHADERACALFSHFEAKFDASPPVEISTWRGCATTNARILEGDRLALESRFKEAQQHFESGLAEEKGDHNSACTLDRLARNLRSLGRFAEAESFAIRAVDSSKTLGPPTVAAVLANNLAGVYLELRRLDKAEVWAREALRLADASFGPDHSETQLMWTTLASVHVHRGDFDRAEPMLRRVLFQLEKSYGPNHIEVALAAGNLADVYRMQHRPLPAIDMFRKALGIFATRPAIAERQILRASSGLMLSYSNAGQMAEASKMVTLALRCAESVFPRNDPDFSTVLHHAALVRSAELDHRSARLLIERSLSILETVYGAQSPALVAPLRTYAYLLRAGKDSKQARIAEARIRTLVRQSQE